MSCVPLLPLFMILPALPRLCPRFSLLTFPVSVSFCGVCMRVEGVATPSAQSTSTPEPHPLIKTAAFIPSFRSLWLFSFQSGSNTTVGMCTCTCAPKQSVSFVSFVSCASGQLICLYASCPALRAN